MPDFFLQDSNVFPFVFISCVWCYAFKHVHIPHACNALRHQKRACDSLELELLKVVSHHVAMEMEPSPL